MTSTGLITWRSGLGTFAALIPGQRWIGTTPSQYPTLPALMNALDQERIIPDVEQLHPQPPHHHDLLITVNLKDKIVVVTDQNNTESVNELLRTNAPAIAGVLLNIVGLHGTPTKALAKLLPSRRPLWQTTGVTIQTAITHGLDLEIEPAEAIDDPAF